MSLFDNMKQTLSDVAGSVLDQSRALSQVAQLQMNLKKLQVERAKKVHELGKKTLDWYRGGSLVVSGPVPPDVGGLCHEIDDLDREYSDSERQIQSIQEAQAAQAAQNAAQNAAENAPPPQAPPPQAMTPPHAQTPPAPPTQAAPPPGAYAPPPNYPPPYPPNTGYNPNAGYGGANYGTPPAPPNQPPAPPAPPSQPPSAYGTSILPPDPPAPGTDGNHPYGPPPGS